jgi:hypothetical protein
LGGLLPSSTSEEFSPVDRKFSLKRSSSEKKLGQTTESLSTVGSSVDPESPQVFGKSLHILLQRRDHAAMEYVPKLVRFAVSSLFNSTAIPNKGLSKDGIFRESGSNHRIQELKQLFDENQIEKYCICHSITNPFDIEDPHVTTGILKMYLRELPEPVATFEMYDTVIRLMKEYGNDEPYIAREMKQNLKRLPIENQRLLNVILYILHQCHLTNDRMKASNLGIVFGGNIFRRDETQLQPQEMMAAMNEIQDLNKMVQILIENYYQLFTGEEPYLGQIYGPYYIQKKQIARCIRELENEQRNPLLASRGRDYVTLLNPLYENNGNDAMEKKVRDYEAVNKVQEPEVITNKPLLPVVPNEPQKLLKASNPKASEAPKPRTETVSKIRFNEPQILNQSSKSHSGLSEPLKWRVNEGAIDEAVLDLRKIIDQNIIDSDLKNQFEDVYARIFHSIYYCPDVESKDHSTDINEDDEDFVPEPIAYAVLLNKKEDIWMRERSRGISPDAESKLRHTKQTLQKLLDSL